MGHASDRDPMSTEKDDKLAHGNRGNKVVASANAFGEAQHGVRFERACVAQHFVRTDVVIDFGIGKFAECDLGSANSRAFVLRARVQNANRSNEVESAGGQIS